MNPRPVIAALTLAVASSGATAQGDYVTWPDPADAALRRTDSGNNGEVLPVTVLPDLLRVTLSAWQPVNPHVNPYVGLIVASENAHLVRLDVVFKGLVNPPGTLGAGSTEFNPHKFGPSPVHGFLEIDVDEDADTGGVIGSAAEGHYLANVGRFGRRPIGLAGLRTAMWQRDYNPVFGSHPQYERSGADFALVFCGCWDSEIVYQSGAPNGVFEAGEVWIVQGRFLQRISGYECSSLAIGGSSFGRYDPRWNALFAHNLVTNETTITLVFPLDMQGAALLANQPQQAPNTNAGDHVSIYEGLWEVAQQAGTATGTCAVIAGAWAGKNPANYLRPERWRVRALFGTAYASQDDTLYAWTDTGMAEQAGDVNSDGIANSLDRAIIQATILSLDGSSEDADGLVNATVLLHDPGINFHMHDVTGDHRINGDDLAFYCPPDCNRDLILNIADIGCFQTKFAALDPYADCNRDGLFNAADFGCYLTGYSLGCP